MAITAFNFTWNLCQNKTMTFILIEKIESNKKYILPVMLWSLHAICMLKKKTFMSIVFNKIVFIDVSYRISGT